MSCRFVCSRTRPFFSFVRGWQGSGQSRRSSYFCPGKERKDLAASQPLILACANMSVSTSSLSFRVSARFVSLRTSQKHECEHFYTDGRI
jgi:hypothetical protein